MRNIMKRFGLFYFITVILLLLYSHIALAQIDAEVKDSSPVHKDATSAANVTNLSVVITPESGKSFVDKSGHVVSTGGLPWTILDIENDATKAIFRSNVPSDANGKSYNSFFRGTFAGSGGSGEPVQWNVATKTNVKDAVLNVFSLQFRNGFTIKNDTDTAMPTNQWQRVTTTNTYPVGYACGKDIQITAVFKVEDPSVLTPSATVKIKGHSSRGYVFPETVGTVQNGYVKVSDDKCGSTENELFITLWEPRCTFPARSVFYLACKNTGATHPNAVINNIWSTFSGRNVSIWNPVSQRYDRKLHYYKDDWADTITTVKGMFADTNIKDQGQCGAWMQLLSQTLAAHSINNREILLVSPPLYLNFGVKNLLLKTNKQADTSPVGIPGQNTSTPSQKLFGRHLIVKCSDYVNGKTIYIDPSYGVFYYTISDYTRGAVDLWQNKSGNEWNFDAKAVLLEK